MKALPATSAVTTLFKYQLLEARINLKFGNVAAFEKATGIQIAPVLSGENPNISMYDVSRASLALSLSETEESAFFFPELYFGRIREEDSAAIKTRYESIKKPAEVPLSTHGGLKTDVLQKGDLSMNEMPAVININCKTENPTVSGRELHTFLEVKERYNDWFPRMCEYGFEEGTDYCSFLSGRSGFSFTEISVKPQIGRPATDHALSIDMAKEVAMIQRTPKGKQARQYFIQAEKAWRNENAKRQILAEYTGASDRPCRRPQISTADVILKLAANLKVSNDARIVATKKSEALAAEIEELKTRLDASSKWLTIRRVARLNSMSWLQFDWDKLKIASEQMDIPVRKIPDARYGAINTYHIDVFRAVFPELKYE